MIGRYQTYESMSEANAPSIVIPTRLNKLLIEEPRFNLKGLGRLFTEQLAIPAEDATIQLYGGTALGAAPAPFDIWRKGFRNPSTNTLHIPVSNMTGTTLMERVITQGVALSEHRSKSFAVRHAAAELMAGSAVTVGATLETDNVITAGLSVAGIAVAARVAKAQTTNGFEFSSSSYEHVQELLEEHSQDLVFPTSI